MTLLIVVAVEVKGPDGTVLMQCGLNDSVVPPADESAPETVELAQARLQNMLDEVRATASERLVDLRTLFERHG